MFRKSFKIKSNSRLKTTEKKKFRNDLLKDFPIIENFLTLDFLSLKANISVVDIVTSSGENVKVYTAPLYPSFILLNGKYFPTVYTLWEVPILVHYFTTLGPVVDKLKKGADLMLPGVIVDEPLTLHSFGSLKRGDPVGINIPDNGSAVAVGEAAMSSVELFNAGRRGKCVNLIHFFGDYLTELAPSVIEVPIRLTNCSVSGSDKLTNNAEDVSKMSDLFKAEITINNEADNFIVKSNEASSANTENVSDISNLTCDSIAENSMEDLLQYCFYKSLVTSAKKTPLPLLTNVFYKVHMMNVYPQGSQIDIKKSKYKKLSTFLEEMAQSKVITLEQNANGIHKITKIDHSHISVREFLKVHPQENNNENKKPSVSQGLCISEKYCVNASVLPLFSKYSYRKGDTVGPTEIRKVITSYIKDEKLLDDSDKRFIKPDALLKTIIKKEVSSLTWEDIMKSITEIMGQSYQVNLPLNKTLSGKGKMPMIEMLVASRAGNKKVTLVNNLSFYGINLNDFSKECQHGVAASTTINSLPHLKSEQVQIQGNQVSFIARLLLDKYQIPKRYIRGLP